MNGNLNTNSMPNSVINKNQPLINDKNNVSHPQS